MGGRRPRDAQRGAVQPYRCLARDEDRRHQGCVDSFWLCGRGPPKLTLILEAIPGRSRFQQFTAFLARIPPTAELSAVLEEWKAREASMVVEKAVEQGYPYLRYLIEKFPQLKSPRCLWAILGILATSFKQMSLAAEGEKARNITYAVAGPTAVLPWPR